DATAVASKGRSRIGRIAIHRRDFFLRREVRMITKLPPSHTRSPQLQQVQRTPHAVENFFWSQSWSRRGASWFKKIIINIISCILYIFEPSAPRKFPKTFGSPLQLLHFTPCFALLKRQQPGRCHFLLWPQGGVSARCQSFLNRSHSNTFAATGRP